MHFFINPFGAILTELKYCPLLSTLRTFNFSYSISYNFSFAVVEKRIPNCFALS